MIIFGTKSTTKVVETGQFFCPNCEAHRVYLLKRLKRWVHLYWIPVLPLEEVSRWVTCDTCKKEYEPRVLEYDPEKQQEKFRTDLARAIDALIRKTAEADPTILRDRVHQIARFRSIFGAEAIDGAANSTATVAEILGPIADRLSDAGRELVVEQMVQISIYRFDLRRSCVDIVFETASALNISSAHLRGIISEAIANEDETTLQPPPRG